MRKYILLFAVILNTVLFAQNPEIPSTTLTNYIPAAPSVSSLMNFAEIPVNEFTGIPNISENIFSVKTLSNKLDFNLGYSYHPKGTSMTQKSSDFGTGWSLNCGGTISRMVMFRPEVTNLNNQNLSYADTYFFNFMGFTGSFQIKYDENNVNPQIVVKRTDSSSLKIQFLKDPNSNKIDSFIIFDTSGNKYVFSIFDVNVSTFYMFTPSYATSIGEKNKQKIAYRSSWHLKEVYDCNNKKLINFNYQTYTRIDNNNTIPLQISINKLNEVDVIGISKIGITFNHFPYMEEDSTSLYFCDSFSVKEILIKDYNNNLIKRVSPDFNNVNFPIVKRNNIYSAQLNEEHKIKRYLEKVNEYNKNNEIIKNTSFSYDLDFQNKNLFIDASGYINAQDSCFVKNPIHWVHNADGLYADYQFSASNPKSSTIGILTGVSYKTGGGYELEFETNTFSRVYSSSHPNKVFEDISFAKLNDENKQFNLIHNISYNTLNSSFVEFQIPNHSLGSKIYYFKFENENLNIPIEVQNSNNLDYNVEYKLAANFNCNGCEFPDSFSDNHLSSVFNFGESCLGKSLYLVPGIYKINIFPYLGLTATGKIKIYEENYNSNLKKYVYGGGNRIKSIKKFEKVVINNKQIQYKENEISAELYNYSDFSDNNSSSGELSYGTIINDMYLSDFSNDYQVNYKNIKKVINNGIGYSKTTFLLPSESLTGYYTIKDGLPLKVELYNSNNDLINTIETSYVFEQDANVDFALDWNNTNLNHYQTIIKNKNIITKEYFYLNSTNTPNTVQNTESFSYNPINKMISEHTQTNSKSETLTTNYFYHTGNSPFSQNRISEIERIETKRGSELLSESKINYSNTFAGNQSFLPSTIEVKKGNSPSEIRLRNNVYDEFGHVLEVQQESGMKISYIYGYNKSQPVAKLENIAYSAIPNALITAIQTATNNTAGTEAQVIAALNALRTSTDVNLKNAMITTLTYKPLIGVSTVTDPKGDTQTYQYDNFNRLQFVKDSSGNILSENEYHYKN